ncbi:hypothetical protein Tco_1121247 [Tanacetum coccineum]|uniref:Uncharacterized protein n=1 Tax=Tanacetum coccineum TaxID=301880 RepID=A0ABQ5IZD3_9ASTR
MNNGTKVGPTLADNTLGMPSYAKLVTSAKSKKSVNFCTLITPAANEVNVVVLIDSIRAISEQFANTAYGFFLGKRVAYPIVANYVRNTWDGLDAMLKNVWVKVYGVPVIAFSKDGLCAIATKLRTPLMLDSYTSDMCMKSWGRLSYAKALIEL